MQQSCGPPCSLYFWFCDFPTHCQGTRTRTYYRKTWAEPPAWSGLRSYPFQASLLTVQVLPRGGLQWWRQQETPFSLIFMKHRRRRKDCSLFFFFFFWKSKWAICLRGLVSALSPEETEVLSGQISFKHHEFRGGMCSETTLSSVLPIIPFLLSRCGLRRMYWGVAWDVSFGAPVFPHVGCRCLMLVPWIPPKKQAL